MTGTVKHPVPNHHVHHERMPKLHHACSLPQEVSDTVVPSFSGSHSSASSKQDAVLNSRQTCKDHGSEKKKQIPDREPLKQNQHVNSDIISKRETSTKHLVKHSLKDPT